MVNRIVIVGRLTRDPEERTTSNGVSVTTFTVACDRGFKNAQGESETDFIPVVTWRGLAETCSKYLRKGNCTAISGRLQVRNYEDKEGNRRTIAEVVADEVKFLTPKGEGAQQKQAPKTTTDDDLKEVAPLDKLPF